MDTGSWESGNIARTSHTSCQEIDETAAQYGYWLQLNIDMTTECWGISSSAADKILNQCTCKEI